MPNSLYEELSEEELTKFEEIKDFEIDKNSLKVSESICPACKEKMDMFIENRNLFDGAMTFHIIKFRCNICKKEYLDMKEAEKYDLYLSLKNIKRPIPNIVETLGKIG